MIEKEEWMHRHETDEKAWNEFKQYFLDCGFKTGTRNGQEVIFAPACGLGMELYIINNKLKRTEDRKND